MSSTVSFSLPQANAVHSSSTTRTRPLVFDDIATTRGWSALKQSPIYMGMGEGQVGVINTLATYYERLRHSDPKIAAQCKHYIDGGLKGIDAVKAALLNNVGTGATIPETGIVGRDGDTNMDSGYLSGGAGAA